MGIRTPASAPTAHARLPLSLAHHTPFRPGHKLFPLLCLALPRLTPTHRAGEQRSKGDPSGDTCSWVCSLARPLSGCAGWGSDSGFLCQMGMMRAPPVGTAQVRVPSNPSYPIPTPDPGWVRPLLWAPRCLYFPATALLSLSPVFPMRLRALGGQGWVCPGLHGSWHTQTLHKWSLREGGNQPQSHLLPTPPPPWLQPHLLFFRFGFLGTCSQGFL